MKVNKIEPESYIVESDDYFPNSHLPVLHYARVLVLPKLFTAVAVKNLFRANDWKNNWKQGIYTYHHYHSVTHEVLGFCKGETLLMLGGENGITLFVQEGDVLVIPAGVAHINLGRENDVTCIGGYPDGRDYDMNYGKLGERPRTDHYITATPLPGTDPVFGPGGPLIQLWNRNTGI
jgi:uncharacterized protein YjlB